MQCPFCHATQAAAARACPTCGGPLQGLNRPPSPAPRPRGAVPNDVALKEMVPTSVAPRAAFPDLPPLARIEPMAPVSPAKPLLLASQTRAKGTPRIVAAFWIGKTEFHPLLVLENGELQGWDLARDEWHAFPPRRTLRAPGLVTGAAFSPECGVVALGFESGQVRLQRIEFSGATATWKCHAMSVTEAHRGPVLALAAAQSRFYSAGADGAVVLTRFSDAPEAKPARSGPSAVVLDGLGGLSGLAVSPDGRRLALGADDGQVQMWHLGDDGLAESLDWSSRRFSSAPQTAVKSLGFSPGGNTLASGNAQGQLCLWAAQTGHRLQAMTQPDGLTSPSFAPDSRLLAHADDSGGIALRDAWTGALQHLLPPVPGGVQVLSFSPASSNRAGETVLVVAGPQQIAAWKVGF